MEKLTATTKELIFSKIERAKAKVEKLRMTIEKTEASDYLSPKELIQFWELEIQLIESEIETLKQYLFTR